MAKMRAILDQENWAEIDVPDEFQTIVTSLFCSESETRELADEVSADIAPSSPKMVLGSDGSPTAEARLQKISQNAEHTDSTPRSESTAQVSISWFSWQTESTNADLELILHRAMKLTQENVENLLLDFFSSEVLDIIW